MNPLVVVSHAGPAAGSLLRIARSVESAVCLVDDGALRLYNPKRDVPLWAAGDFGTGDRVLRQRYVERLAEEHGSDRIIALGVKAIRSAIDLSLGLPIDGILQRGELDFRYGHNGASEVFERASRRVSSLYFDSEHVMDRAVAHGSHAKHFLMPISSVPVSLLGEDIERPHVVIVYPGEWKKRDTMDRLHHVERLLATLDVPTQSVTADFLYTSRDLAGRRGFPATIRYRISSEATHVLVLGDSRHHTAVIGAFAARHADRVFVDSTISNERVAQRAGIEQSHIARGHALIERLVASWKGSGRALAPQAAGALAPLDALRTFYDNAALSLPDWFEEGIADPRAQAFDVFFSVAPIENRSDGARPQRIREMARSFRHDMPVLRLSSNIPTLGRRGSALRELITQGSRPRWGYGENSTTPMTDEARTWSMRVLSVAKRAGLRMAWFVRDLHWLSDESNISHGDTDRLAEIQRRGLAEVRAMVSTADVVYAPSEGSAAEFDRLLHRAELDLAVPWRTLPPAASDVNTLGLPSSDGPLRLVYSGGFGGIYSLAELRASLERLEGDWTLDLIVRENDLEAVDGFVAGLPAERISVEVGEFTDYAPKPGVNVGIVLLDSTYGQASFPFKTMSYWEKRIPVLCYAGSGPAPSVTDTGAGIVVDRAEGSIESALTTLMRTPGAVRADWQRVSREHTWQSRAAQVRADLSSAG